MSSLRVDSLSLHHIRLLRHVRQGVHFDRQIFHRQSERISLAGAGMFGDKLPFVEKTVVCTSGKRDVRRHGSGGETTAVVAGLKALHGMAEDAKAAYMTEQITAWQLMLMRFNERLPSNRRSMKMKILYHLRRRYDWYQITLIFVYFVCVSLSVSAFIVMNVNFCVCVFLEYILLRYDF
jgi:hypothetical protein